MPFSRDRIGAESVLGTVVPRLIAVAVCTELPRPSVPESTVAEPSLTANDFRRLPSSVDVRQPLDGFKARGAVEGVAVARGIAPG